MKASGTKKPARWSNRKPRTWEIPSSVILNSDFDTDELVKEA